MIDSLHLSNSTHLWICQPLGTHTAWVGAKLHSGGCAGLAKDREYGRTFEIQSRGLGSSKFCMKPVSVKYTSVCWAQLTRRRVCGTVVAGRKVLDHTGYTRFDVHLGKVDTGWPATLLTSAEGLLPAGNQFLLSLQISLYVTYTNLKMDLILQLVDFLWIKLHNKDIVIKSTRRKKCHKK